MEHSTLKKSNRVEYEVQTQGFLRYLALRQFNYEIRNSSMGSIIYASLLLVLPQNYRRPQTTLITILLGTLCLWPLFVRLQSKEFYARWRTVLLVANFTLQHVFSPYFLISNGIDLRKHTPVKNAFHLLLVSLTGRTMLWLGLNGIAYKTKLHVFLIWQALVVVLTLPMELGTCEWALSTHPRLAENLFGTLHAWGGLLAGASMPPVDSLEHVSPLAGIKHDCYHVQTYFAIMFGYVMPAVVIWLYERSVWKEFLVSDPTDLAWPGGPTSGEIGQALATLKEKETRKQQEIPIHKLQCVGLVVLCSITIWHLVEGFKCLLPKLLLNI